MYMSGYKPVWTDIDWLYCLNSTHLQLISQGLGPADSKEALAVESPFSVFYNKLPVIDKGLPSVDSGRQLSWVSKSQPSLTEYQTERAQYGAIAVSWNQTPPGWGMHNATRNGQIFQLLMKDRKNTAFIRKSSDFSPPPSTRFLSC